jgi:hypothetical protein
MTLFLLSIFVGCADNGTGEVTTSGDAPWDMNGASAFLFTPGPDNDGRQGVGVLAISTDGSHACADVRDGAPAGGSGLWFDIGYFTGRAPGAASPAWDGLYASGLATATDSSASRTLDVAGWHKGFVYTFAGTDAWLEISQGAQDKFIGRFATEWWKGDFNAKVCEGGDQPIDDNGGDTGL